MRVDFEEILKEFYDLHKDGKLKNYPFKDVSNVVKTPFRYLRRSIKEGLFEDIRFKHIGVFRVREYQVRRKILLYKEFYKTEEGKGEKTKNYKLEFFKSIWEKMENYIKKVDDGEI